MPINTITVELTNKCDLNCKFCIPDRKEKSLKFSTFKHIVKESQKVNPPIKSFEFGFAGSPFLYKRFHDALKLLQKNKLGLNIVTNGFNLKWNLGFIDDDLMKNVGFCIYLESPDEAKCDSLTGVKKYYQKTIEAIEYMNARRIPYNIFMRMTPFNYQEIENMLELLKFYSGGLLFPIETFPYTDEDLVLTDEMKKQVTDQITTLQNYGEPIRRNVQFSEVEGNCTYQRMERFFINSEGKVGFCHFLTPLNKTELFDVKNLNLSKLIEANNKIRVKYLERKSEDLKTWERPRQTVSPCSYCLYHFGLKKNW
jgi:MoaA/NifB/PqqE/SkfB family radical SAM enzyme